MSIDFLLYSSFKGTVSQRDSVKRLFFIKGNESTGFSFLSAGTKKNSALEFVHWLFYNEKFYAMPSIA